MVIAVTRPRAQGYGASIKNIWFRLAPDDDLPLRIYTRDSLAERQDQRGNPEENVLDIGYAFSRSNFTGGEGLDWWPRTAGEQEIPTDQIRFWDSENLEIRRPDAGEPYKLDLVPSFTDFWTPVSTPVDMGTSRDSVYVITGQIVNRFDDWADSTPEDTDDLGVALTQLAVGPDGSVAVLDTTGDIWFKGAQTDSYLKVYDTTADGDAAIAVWYLKDRIIAVTNDAATADQGALLEIAPVMGGTPASPTVTPIFTTIDTFQDECYDVIDAGHAIVASFSDGSIRSYVPETDTAGGVPVLTIRGRTQVPTGEVAYRMGHNLGILLFLTLEELPGMSLTTVRLYSSSVLDVRFDYVVGSLQLLRVWNDTVETTPSYTDNMVSTRDEIFFGIGEAANTYNIWRVDLVTTGLFRHAATTQTDMIGLVFFDNILAWCEGGDVVIEDTTQLATTGYLITPNITFGLNTPINWSSFTLDVLNLATGGAQVEFSASTDPEAILDVNHVSWQRIALITDPVQSGIETPIIDLNSKQLSLKLELTSSTNGLVSPTVNRTAVRGLPEHRDWIVELPVNVSDMVTAPGRMPLRVGGHGDATHNKLVDLQGASTTLEVLDPPLVLRGVVDVIMEPTHYITDRGSQGRRCMVRFLGIPISSGGSGATQGNAGWGIMIMGIGTMGTGEQL